MAIIEEASEYNIKKYNQATPIPAKFLQMNGKVTNLLGRTGGEVNLKYHLYAWDYGSGFCVGYTEKEVPVAGDLLFLKQDMGEGKITDPTELKMIYHVVSDSDGVITVSEHPEGQSGYTFTRNPDDDYEESINDIRDCVDITQNGLFVSQKGTALKSLNVNVGSSASPKLYCWYCNSASDGAKYIYSLSETPLYNQLYRIDTSSFNLITLNFLNGKISSYDSNNSFIINYKLGVSTTNLTYSRRTQNDITL